MIFQKHDTGKVDLSLLPFEQLETVARVLEYGEHKYSRDNWKLGNRGRYIKAGLRHVWGYMRGEKIDQESGLPSLAHAVCCFLFAMFFDDMAEKAPLAESIDE